MQPARSIGSASRAAQGLRSEASRRHLSRATSSESWARATQAQALGRRAEQVVADYLRRSGVAVVATNLRVGRLELDIVAREGRTVLVVEVRARAESSWTTGFGSLQQRKRQRIRRAVERLWQRRYRHDPSVDRIRIDAASVTFDENGGALVEYAKAAF